MSDRSERFDTFLKRKTDILTGAQIRGLDLFLTDARCLHGHNGPARTDGAFHDVGLGYYGCEREGSGGVPDAVATERRRTAPYMHNGLFDLDGVLRIYNAGMPTLRRSEKQMDDPNFPTKSPRLKPLGLNNRDLADLEAFLRCLDEPARKVRPPAVTLPAER